MRFIILFLAVTFFSCNTNPASTIETKDDVKENKNPSQPVEENECYWLINKRDTLMASLTQNGNNISGKLIFDNYEKDGSRGNVTGIAEGDVLKLWYTFRSEGMTSIMEVWFKKGADKLLRGIGPTTQKEDSSYFTDKTKVIFTGTSMDKVDCKELDKYVR